MEYDEISNYKYDKKEELIIALAFTFLPLLFIAIAIAVPDTPKEVLIVLPIALSLFLAIGIAFIVRQVREVINIVTIKLLKRSGKKATAVVERAEKTKSKKLRLIYSFTNDYGEDVVRRTDAVFLESEVEQFIRERIIGITYYKNLSRITHSSIGFIKQDLAQRFERYAREDKMFAVIKKELDKEVGIEAKRKLLAQHDDLMPPQTKKRIEEYLSS